jgi:PEP-CTERM motif
MKPKIVFFAAASLVATGMTLASNVSFGQRAGKALADMFDIMGPVSGLVAGIVRPSEEGTGRQTGTYAAGLPLDGLTSAQASYQSTYQPLRYQGATATSAFIGTAPATEILQQGGSARRKGIEWDIKSGGPNVPARLEMGAGFGKSTQGTLLSAFAKGAPNALTNERDDVWAFMKSRPDQFDVSKYIIGRSSERIDKETALTTNATPDRAASTRTGASTDSTDPAAPGATTTASTLTAASLATAAGAANAVVPVPASMLVFGIGLAALAASKAAKRGSKGKKRKA